MDKKEIGIKINGEWEEVVKDGKKLQHILEEIEQADEKQVQKWKYWRPKKGEEMDKMKDKSLNKVVKKREINKSEHSADKKLNKSKNELFEAFEELRKALKKFGLVLFNYISYRIYQTKADLRKGESKVLKFIQNFSSGYYETEEFSSKIKEKDDMKDKFKSKDEKEYEVEVKFNDKNIEKEVKDRIDDSKHE